MGGEAKYCSDGRCSGLLPYDDKEAAEREGKGGDGEGRGEEEVRRTEEVGRKNRGGMPFKTTFSMAYFFLDPTTSQ